MRLIDADAVCERCRASGAICTGKDCEIPNMPTLTPQNEWVSVEERRPEDKQIVLFHQKNGFIYCAEYFAGNNLMSPAWFIDNDCWEVDEVTHWMPLPAPPDSRPPEGEEDT